MSHYKGRTATKTIERDFPQIVEIAVPPDGLGKTLDAMYDFHDQHGIKVRRGQSRRDEAGRNYIRWCFAVARMAKKFADEIARSI
jgi:hypothetical protein